MKPTVPKVSSAPDRSPRRLAGTARPGPEQATAPPAGPASAAADGPSRRTRPGRQAPVDSRRPASAGAATPDHGEPRPPAGPAERLPGAREAAPASAAAAVSPLPPSACHVQRFRLEVEYPVYFTQRVFDVANPILGEVLGRREPARRQRVLVVLDGGLAEATPGLEAAIRHYAAAHGERLVLAGPVQVLPGGEMVKNEPRWASRLQRALQRARLDRQSFLLAVGGGALLDCAGYVAATVHRGVRLIRLPTTVLAQNDSGVGVKNGVNLRGAKNFLGTFSAPFAVINDSAFLETLSARDLTAGMAEAVKVALLKDRGYFEWLEAHAGALASHEPGALSTLIRRCAELHMAQISGGGDPFEQGSARPLDFGHWAAHKLETLSGYRLRHGEAVAIGMALDLRYAMDSGLLPAAMAMRAVTLLERLGFQLWDAALDTTDAGGRPLLLDGLQEFREHLGGELSVTLVRAPGEAVEVHTMDPRRVLAAAAWLRNRKEKGDGGIKS